MNDEIKEKIKAYYIGNDIDKVLDCITNLQEENERLNKRVKECEEAYLRTRQQYSELKNKYLTDEYIINELERYLEDEKINLDDYLGCLDDEERHYEIVRLRPRYNDFKEIYDKLQELKGDSNE